MKHVSDHEHHNLKSIDRNLIQTVIQTYTGRKASGCGEMAARNAAILVLREALPSWTFRATSEMVSQIIALDEPPGQAA